MRFARLRKNTPNHIAVKRAITHPLSLVRMVYNVIWWVPMILSFTGVIDYRTGFIAFFAVTVFRLVVNIYVNYNLDLEKFEKFPLKA
jgi:phosphatidylglycerophosphate synthase